LVCTMVASAPRCPALRIFTISSNKSIGLFSFYRTPLYAR
jgi:hypothetical protein